MITSNPTENSKWKSDFKSFLERFDLKCHAESLVKYGYSTIFSLRNIKKRQLLGWDWSLSEANRLLLAVKTFAPSGDTKNGESQSSTTISATSFDATTKKRKLNSPTNSGVTESERKRIEYALEVLDPKSIQAILRIKAASGQDGLRKVKEILTDDLAPAPSNPLALCFRCGVRYDPNYPSVCCMPHPANTVECEAVDVTLGDKRYDFNCGLCGKNWESETKEYKEAISKGAGHCWKGPHDPHDEEVRQREGWGDPLILGENATDYLEMLRTGVSPAGQLSFDIMQPKPPF
mmetsp:Transcript_9590/g.13406  ORF Transcript_9590/g.13406 Transcript_9590/m.13406 type:complete len:291 (+) Transcript_9590:333-1205(+)|eukprot:CAMPEP_0184486044 /NCGR_PEP_ID=MMETSP0113_2-20130426/7589_1 /TAXON_ID=91329 /ORGANISM="Norrisiella sphaerica, Strain BC52" /LENGTH=290 /DNA_ID=CAMNT_0026867753 /DNA_START=238 /DNA_END=1113 /DNA_ORIENTATION=+